MTDQAWINGRLLPAAEATVSIFDHGLTVGDGVFETLKAIEGVPFATRRHLARLRHSADGLGLHVHTSDDELRAAMAAVLGPEPPPLARVRITVTGGSAPLGSDRGDALCTVIVAAGPLASAEPTTAVCTVPWPRNERSAVAGIKTTSYAENVRALAFAKDRGCTEALFTTTTGLLCEGTGSNVFVVLRRSCDHAAPERRLPRRRHAGAAARGDRCPRGGRGDRAAGRGRRGLPDVVGS